jgi:hypothetical protein
MPETDTTGHTLELADVLAGTWRDRFASPPPADWLAHAAQAMDAHLAALIARARAHAADTSAEVARSTADELTRLRTRIGTTIAAAVGAGHLDLDFANSILTAVGLPTVRRAYAVYLRVPLEVAVTAETTSDAFAARVVIEEYLGPDDQVRVGWDDIENTDVDAGGVDTPAI